jgi:hypothetical protein
MPPATVWPMAGNRDKSAKPKESPMPCIVADTEYTTWPGSVESGWSGPGQGPSDRDGGPAVAAQGPRST